MGHHLVHENHIILCGFTSGDSFFTAGSCIHGKAEHFQGALYNLEVYRIIVRYQNVSVMNANIFLCGYRLGSRSYRLGAHGSRIYYLLRYGNRKGGTYTVDTVNFYGAVH